MPVNSIYEKEWLSVLSYQLSVKEISDSPKVSF